MLVVLLLRQTYIAQNVKLCDESNKPHTILWHGVQEVHLSHEVQNVPVHLQHTLSAWRAQRDSVVESTMGCVTCFGSASGGGLCHIPSKTFWNARFSVVSLFIRCSMLSMNSASSSISLRMCSQCSSQSLTCEGLAAGWQHRLHVACSLFCSRLDTTCSPSIAMTAAATAGTTHTNTAIVCQQPNRTALAPCARCPRPTQWYCDSSKNTCASRYRARPWTRTCSPLPKHGTCRCAQTASRESISRLTSNRSMPLARTP